MVRSSYLFVNRFGVVIRPKATEKRNGEHDAFVKEQLDFDNAIAACHKATSSVLLAWFQRKWGFSSCPTSHITKLSLPYSFRFHIILHP